MGCGAQKSRIDEVLKMYDGPPKVQLPIALLHLCKVSWHREEESPFLRGVDDKVYYGSTVKKCIMTA